MDLLKAEFQITDMMENLPVISVWKQEFKYGSALHLVNLRVQDRCDKLWLNGVYLEAFQNI